MATEYWRIRKNWNGGKWDKEQLAAYTSIGEALTFFRKDMYEQGYRIFNPDGSIYPTVFDEEEPPTQEKSENTCIMTLIKLNEPGKNLRVFEATDDIVKNATSIADLCTFAEESKQPNNNSTIAPPSIVQKKEEEVGVIYLNESTRAYKIPVSKFKIVYADINKRGLPYSTYANAGYFGNYDEGNAHFTLPSANLICDINKNEVNPIALKYLMERKIENGKLYFSAKQNSGSQFRNDKRPSTLVVFNKSACIVQINEFTDTMRYAVSGYPILLNGCVTNPIEIKNEGWLGSELYKTYHGFIGVKEPYSEYIYYIPMKTTSNNLTDIVKIFDPLKLTDIIKLDGGGSAYFKYNDKEIMNTPEEDRRINSIITF